MGPDLKPPKGLLAVALAERGQLPSGWPRAVRALCGDEAHLLLRDERKTVCLTGFDECDVVDTPTGRLTMQLSVGSRSIDRDVTSDDVASLLSAPGRAPGLSEILPPFAGAHQSGRDAPLRVATDFLGFRQVYLAQGDGWAGVSTSARALAECVGEGIDREGVFALAFLGWHIGSTTVFRGVSTLAPGATVDLHDGTLSLATEPARSCPRPRDLASAVATAGERLQLLVGSYLDDHPQALLQLTGGQDSRILLAAVEPSRRMRLEAMTLAVQGSPDVLIAGDIAARQGMRHLVTDLSGINECTPAEAHRLATWGARRLECGADPLAWTSLTLSESDISARARLSGLGGEVVRGFYYVGRVRARPVTRRRVRQLSRWRLFPNESVPRTVLHREFSAQATKALNDRLYRIMADNHQDWNAATDDLYLMQRMRRWAGTLATATCLDRSVVNPMLDRRFLELGSSMPPEWKARSRFLASLCCALDPSLAAFPLDGRPAPAVYARGGYATSARLTFMTSRKVAGKAAQRLRAQRRPPEGGESLGSLVVRHWQAKPELLDGVRGLGVFAEEWLDRLLAGTTSAPESAVALLVNLEVALENHRTTPASV